jgi:hypothetical protein
VPKVQGDASLNLSGQRTEQKNRFAIFLFVMGIFFGAASTGSYFLFLGGKSNARKTQ